MSISLIGPSGTYEFPWIRYALLRDNILHHLEHGVCTSAFTEIYKIGISLGGSPALLSAKTLRQEVIRAQALCQLPIDQLAISARTLAVLRFESPLPEGPPTRVVGVALNLPWLSESAQQLADVFGDLVTALLQMTDGASDSDHVEVIET
ncbi:MAG: hypothetical protein JNM40_00605 [Myxococcales bacterium]|nr:hypothetical protein [Myxococcales bacterium]